jgi:hypothetical protein
MKNATVAVDVADKKNEQPLNNSAQSDVKVCWWADIVVLALTEGCAVDTMHHSVGKHQHGIGFGIHPNNRTNHRC